jgi:hypothetical protein
MLGNARRWFAVSSPDLPRRGWPTVLPVAFSIFSRNRSLPTGISVRHAADKTKRHPQFKGLTIIVCATSPIPPQRLFERKKQDACLFQVTDTIFGLSTIPGIDSQRRQFEKKLKALIIRIIHHSFLSNLNSGLIVTRAAA